MFDLARFLSGGRPTKLMGIVNATGNSFSEGAASTADSAVERALALLEAGADVLDLGGESTRPGAQSVSPALEMRRVIPVLETLHRLRPDVIFSVDTRHAEVAAAALAAGASIINDVSMLRNAPEIAKIVAAYGGALILSHSRGTPENMQSEEFCSYPGGVISGVRAELEAAEKVALASGVPKENVMLDPGIGFAKTPEQCWELLAHLDELGNPHKMMVGVSRKFFLGALTGELIPACRDGETLAVELELAAMGVGMIRTHSVRALRNALLAGQRLKRERR